MAAETTEVARQGIGIRDLLEAGLHFGHQTKRWNPKMKRYIFDKRNGIHVIDLAKSLALLNQALDFVHDTVVGGRSVLFVGTKKQAQKVIRETAETSGQHYVTHRWLGGTLTNRATVRRSVHRMRELQRMEEDGTMESVPKKEAASLRRELTKLDRNLSGVADMSDLPGAVFVVDTMREAIAVNEANKLKIPVIAIVDTNCDPDQIDYVIPGNDDAIRAIKLIAGAMGDTAKQAADEYARIAAELERKRKAEEEARKKAQEEARKKAEAARQAAEQKQKAEEQRRKIAAAEAKAAKKAEAKTKPAEAEKPAAQAAPTVEPKTAAEVETPAEADGAAREASDTAPAAAKPPAPDTESAETEPTATKDETAG